MSEVGDRLIDFEADNFDSLVDKFLKEKEVVELWADFVYNEYINSSREPDDMEDR